MRDGEPLVFQAQFLSGLWQGRADFLRRIGTPAPNLGDYSYEVLDTKLARHVKPSVVHQLSLYSRLLGEIQSLQPTHAYVILGDGTIEPVELARYAALHRHVSAHLERERPTRRRRRPTPSPSPTVPSVSSSNDAYEPPDRHAIATPSPSPSPSPSNSRKP